MRWPSAPEVSDTQRELGSRWGRVGQVPGPSTVSRAGSRGRLGTRLSSTTRKTTLARGLGMYGGGGEDGYHAGHGGDGALHNGWPEDVHSGGEPSVATLWVHSECSVVSKVVLMEL